jgi:hypothetical protein
MTALDFPLQPAKVQGNIELNPLMLYCEFAVNYLDFREFEERSAEKE